MVYNQAKELACSQDEENSRDSTDSDISDLLDIDEFRALQNVVSSDLIEQVEMSAATSPELSTGLSMASYEPGNLLQLPGSAVLESTDVSSDEEEEQNTIEKIRDYNFKTKKEKEDPKYKKMRNQNKPKVREWRAKQKVEAENKNQRLHFFEAYFVQQGWALPDPTTLGFPEGFGVHKFVAREKQLKQWKDTYGEQWKM